MDRWKLQKNKTIISMFNLFICLFACFFVCCPLNGHLSSPWLQNWVNPHRLSCLIWQQRYLYPGGGGDRNRTEISAKALYLSSKYIYFFFFQAKISFVSLVWSAWLFCALILCVLYFPWCFSLVSCFVLVFCCLFLVSINVFSLKVMSLMSNKLNKGITF